MADPIIRIKRSSVGGKIPTSDQLPLGEIALNTYDGKFYASKDVGIGTTVFAVNPWSAGLGTDSYDIHFTEGSVGIGTTVPTATLDVIGDANIVGVLTATSFAGDGSGLTNITAAGTISVASTVGPVGTGVTLLDFKGSAISSLTVSAGIATVTTSSNPGLLQVSTRSGTATVNYTVGQTNSFVVNGRSTNTTITL